MGPLLRGSLYITATIVAILNLCLLEVRPTYMNTSKLAYLNLYT